MSIRQIVPILVVLFVGCFGPSVPPNQANAAGTIPAFPGAEGYGAQSLGGRGGQVIEVTNLDDSGPGSLRAAIETDAPRIVVFRVGGTIELRTSLVIKYPYITIAGQTSPGGGIALKTHPTMDNAALEVAAEHVVVRYIRARPGPMTELSKNVDALVIGENARFVMIDHCSFSWSTDETISIWYEASDITVQWSIIAEALRNSTHDGEPQSYGILTGDQSTRISLHHNLLAHNYRRNPRIAGGTVDVVNNIIYNSANTPTRFDGNKVEGNVTDARFNYVGNFIKSGPDHNFDYEVKLLETGIGAALTLFVADNIGPNRPDDSVPDQAIVSPDGRRFLVDTRHDMPLVTTTSAGEAYDQVLASAGANRPALDAVDLRIINDVINGTGRIIDDPAEVGGWPRLAVGTPPTDSDHDGMPDSWETQHGLAPDNADDGAADIDGDGYTSVEEYLNGTDPGSSVEQAIPNIAEVIQEIVDRTGWSSGHALAIIITGSGVRTAESYDGVPTGAPLLRVEFIINRTSSTVAVRVAANTDDAEESESGTMFLTSSDLELVHNGYSNQTVGMRFNDVAIPPGATIANAYVQFQVDEASTAPASLIIQGEAADNAVTFSAANSDISSRPRTRAAVSWSPAPWTTVGNVTTAATVTANNTSLPPEHKATRIFLPHVQRDF